MTNTRIFCALRHPACGGVIPGGAVQDVQQPHLHKFYQQYIGCAKRAIFMRVNALKRKFVVL